MRFKIDEIQKYLDNYRPFDDMHRRAIEHICLEHGLSINFDKKGIKLEPLKFKKFQRWLCHPTFHPGEIIVVETKRNKKIIIMVKKAHTNYIIPEATLDSDNVFIKHYSRISSRIRKFGFYFNHCRIIEL